MNRQLTQLVREPVALALVDIDHFKQINDRFSHDAGDRVLCHLAATLQAHIEALGCPEGFVARIGGEEFVLAMPGVDHEAALHCCERLRVAVELGSWGEIATGLRVTVSIGLAAECSGDGDASTLLGRADAQLYNAKRRGRNRVVSELS
jgi:diguanylate cyclase (GGDEF)-like protein